MLPHKDDGSPVWAFRSTREWATVYRRPGSDSRGDIEKGQGVDMRDSASEGKQDRAYERVGQALAMVFGVTTAEGVRVVELRLTHEYDAVVFLVAKGVGPDGALVAFRQIDRFPEGLWGFYSDLKGGALKWQMDKWPGKVQSRVLSLLGYPAAAPRE